MSKEDTNTFVGSVPMETSVYQDMMAEGAKLVLGPSDVSGSIGVYISNYAEYFNSKNYDVNSIVEKEKQKLLSGYGFFVGSVSMETSVYQDTMAEGAKLVLGPSDASGCIGVYISNYQDYMGNKRKK